MNSPCCSCRWQMCLIARMPTSGGVSRGAHGRFLRLFRLGGSTRHRLGLASSTGPLRLMPVRGGLWRLSCVGIGIRGSAGRLFGGVPCPGWNDPASNAWRGRHPGLSTSSSSPMPTWPLVRLVLGCWGSSVLTVHRQAVHFPIPHPLWSCRSPRDAILPGWLRSSTSTQRAV